MVHRHCSGILKKIPAGFQNMYLDTKLTVMDAADAKTLANSTSRRPESNGRRPGPGFGKTPVKQIKTLFSDGKADPDPQLVLFYLFLCFGDVVAIGSMAPITRDS